MDLIHLARSERFELPTLGIEIRCSIQLSYERAALSRYQTCRKSLPEGVPLCFLRRLNSQPCGKSTELGFQKLSQQLRSNLRQSLCMMPPFFGRARDGVRDVDTITAHKVIPKTPCKSKAVEAGKGTSVIAANAPCTREGKTGSRLCHAPNRNRASLGRREAWAFVRFFTDRC